jgi:hypothetical protein
MQVSEEQLRTVISESIKKILIDYGLIEEMAVSSKEYKRRVYGLVPQICENWCLIYFYRRTGLETTCINHWCDELYSHMDNLGKILVKGGNRTKILYTVWNEYEYDSNISTIDRCIRNKFKKECVEVNRYYDYYVEACNSFMRSTREIVTVMVNGGSFDIENYISNIGKQQVFE